MEIRSDALIAVIGAGTMGAGIAQAAAQAGHQVMVVDAQAPALASGRATVDAGLSALVRRGTVDPAAKSAIEARIGWSTELDDAAGAALLIEAIVERLGAKRALFATLSSIVGAETILASNTSSLSIGAMADATAKPERFLGLHFFNPVAAMRLVEVVPGQRTAPAVLDAARDLMARWGKRPVTVRDVPGFIVNRVARPYYAEGFVAFGEGMAPATIDHALTAAGGFRMGPLSLADLIGHDVNYAVATSVFEAYGGATRFRPQDTQRALVDRGRLGRKTGVGVYDYGGELPTQGFAPFRVTPIAVAAGPETSLLAPLVEAARAAGIVVHTDPWLSPETLVVDGARIALGDGRTLAQRPEVNALLDHARDFATAGTLVATAGADVAEIVAGFAQAIGRKALLVPDRPGQIVLRTLAQLANAAADAMSDAVATFEGIDEAMVHGANHPEGPLRWAARLGYGPVASALAHIAGETCDPIYAPARLLTGGVEAGA